MKKYPHIYTVQASTEMESVVKIENKNHADLRPVPPIIFSGPGDRWSPGTLLIATVVDCFMLNFETIAKSSGFPWSSLCCDAKGVLDRICGNVPFTEFHLNAILEVKAGLEDQAYRLLHRAEHNYLVTNSLKAEIFLESNLSITEDIEII